MASGQVGGSIAYRAFLVHQRAIGSRIRASSGCVTVFYSGSDHGVAVWKQVERDRDFREFYERYRKRNSLLARYGMADQLSRSWH
jgi:hypothetical protein